MGNVRIELLDTGVQELLRDPKIMEALDKAAQPVMARLGDGYEKDQFLDSDPESRCRVGIRPVSPEAIRDCLENNTLLKALRG